MDIKELHCKNCGAPIEEKNIDYDLSIARCLRCSTVFGLIDSMKERIALKKKSVPMPEKFIVEHVTGILTISYKWFKIVHIFLIFFSAIWNGFMVFWYYMAISSGIWIMALFGILHVAVGLWLLYYTLTGFFNKTIIKAGLGDLEIKHTPLPWPGNRKISSMDIKQIYCKEKTHHGKNGVSYSYEVHAINKKNGKAFVLLKSLDEPEQALFIEQELEKFLGIKDEAVPGEYTC